MQRMHCKISRSTNPRSAASSARGGCSSGWSSPTPKGRGSLPDTDHPRERGFVNVQALKRGDTLLLVLAAHPSRPAPNKKRGELRWPTKPLEGTPYSLTAEERAPRGPKSLLFTYKMYCNSFVFLSLLYSYNPLPSWMAPLSRGHPVILPLYTRSLTGREINRNTKVSREATPPPYKGMDMFHHPLSPPSSRRPT